MDGGKAAQQAAGSNADWELICFLRLVVGDSYTIEYDGCWWFVNHGNPSEVVYPGSTVMLAQLIWADFISTVHAEKSTTDETALEWLHRKWGDEYSIGVCPVRGWWAIHWQRTRIITARTADGLALSILADSFGIALPAVESTVPRQRTCA